MSKDTEPNSKRFVPASEFRRRIREKRVDKSLKRIERGFEVFDRVQKKRGTVQALLGTAVLWARGELDHNPREPKQAKGTIVKFRPRLRQ